MTMQVYLGGKQPNLRMSDISSDRKMVEGSKLSSNSLVGSKANTPGQRGYNEEMKVSMITTESDKIVEES